MNFTPSASPRLAILRLKQVLELTGLSKSTVYGKLKPHSPRYDASFPKQIRVSAGVVGWVDEEIEAWILSRIEASRA